jgi:putative membrane protein
MTTVSVVLLVAVIITVVFAIRYLARGGSHYNGASSEATRAEDALAQRFARGEIDEDEYRRRMTLLREHR